VREGWDFSQKSLASGTQDSRKCKRLLLQTCTLGLHVFVSQVIVCYFFCWRMECQYSINGWMRKTQSRETCLALAVWQSRFKINWRDRQEKPCLFVVASLSSECNLILLFCSSLSVCLFTQFNREMKRGNHSDSRHENDLVTIFLLLFQTSSLSFDWQGESDSISQWITVLNLFYHWIENWMYIFLVKEIKIEPQSHDLSISLPLVLYFFPFPSPSSPWLDFFFRWIFAWLCVPNPTWISLWLLWMTSTTTRTNVCHDTQITRGSLPASSCLLL